MCPNCGEVRDFKLSLMEDGKAFAISCGFCDVPIRHINSYKFDEAPPKAIANVSFPFGKKYKGVVISTMNRKEDITYLTWVRNQSDMWQYLNDEVKGAINYQIDNHSKKKAMGVKEEESQIPEPQKKFDPLKDFLKNFDGDSLSV